MCHWNSIVKPNNPTTAAAATVHRRPKSEGRAGGGGGIAGVAVLQCIEQRSGDGRALDQGFGFREDQGIIPRALHDEGQFVLVFPETMNLSDVASILSWSRNDVTWVHRPFIAGSSGRMIDQ